jgi:hypothetical protein
MVDFLFCDTDAGGRPYGAQFGDIAQNPALGHPAASSA